MLYPRLFIVFTSSAMHSKAQYALPVVQESEVLKPLVNEWLGQIPANRLALLTDLQAAVVYLASETSDYISGHNLIIDGGHTRW